MLFQNDDYGKDLLNGLKRGIQRSKVKVVAAEPYEVTASDVQAQVAKLKASGADTFAIFATPKFAIQAYVYANKLGWKPKLTLNNAVSSASNIMQLASEGGTNKVVNGSVSIVFLKDPTDPKWRKDAAMKLYRQIMKQYAPGANAERRLPRLRHGGGLDGRRGPEEGRQEPDPRRARQGRRRTLNLSSNPFLLPGDRAQDGRGRPLPDRADAAPALAEGRLEELRRALGLPRRVARAAIASRGPARAGPRRFGGAAARSGPGRGRWRARRAAPRRRRRARRASRALEPDVVTRLDVCPGVGDVEPAVPSPRRATSSVSALARRLLQRDAVRALAG